MYQLGSCWSMETTTPSKRWSINCQEHVFLLASEQKQTKDEIDTKKREIENIEIHEVYECVPGMGQKCLSTKWMITEKSKDNKKIIKACLVAHGYEHEFA